MPPFIRGGLGLLLGTVVLVSAAAGHVVETAAPPEDLVPDFMSSTPKKSTSNLRTPSVVIQEHMLEVKKDDLKMAQLDRLSEEEKVELMDSLKGSMIKLDATIDDVDLTGYDEIESLTEIGRDYTSKAIKAVDDAISFMKSIVYDSSDGGDEKEEDDPDDLEADDAKIARRLEIEAGYEEPPKWNKHQSGYEKARAGKHHYRQQRRRAKQKFGNTNHHGEYFKARAGSHHARKLEQFREAIFNGNIHSAFSSFSFGQHNSQRRHSRERRLRANERGLLSYDEQCQLLSECALRMSIYDIFVYYFSDDIDPGNGQVDTNLVKFDEQDIQHMHSEIRRWAELIRDHGAKKDYCNNLLATFHRTIEHGEIPEWQGASINQVCLAEGSTVFVQYQEMTTALIDQRFVNGYNKASENEYYENTEAITKLMKEDIVVEPFRCAEELFYRGDRTDQNEEFPFGGCGGKDSNKCSSSKYKIPVSFDVATTESAPKRYETLRKRIQCDRGYEIKTQEQCLEAGQAVGGTLKDEELVEGNGDDAPCGCSLDPTSDKAINWVARIDGCTNKNWKYSVVCEEHKNRDDYEVVQWQKECESEYSISSTECMEAGLAVGGSLDEYQVADHKHRPCGCYLDLSGKISYDSGTQCQNHKNSYQTVCKRKEDRDYVSLRKRTKCDVGFEVKSQEECSSAGRSVGGLGTWHPLQASNNKKKRPCGCFVDHRDKSIHWNDGSTCQNDDNWNWDVVCKPNLIAEKYKGVQFTTKCEAGNEITSVEECAEAGQALGGYLGNYVVTRGNWKNKPCGCFMDNNGKIYYDTGSKGCGNTNWSYEPICHASSDEEQLPGRDVHGKLLSNDNSGFVTMSYVEVNRQADSCMTSKLASMDEQCLEDSGDQVTSKYYECRVIKRQEAIEECDRFGPVNTGLELVFGTQTSPGFICGIMDAIVNDGVPMPGKCCLDAPYELDGAHWGQPYQCENDCKNPGPYLAGINEEACSAQGGTWCPTESDCKALKDCVATLTEQATEEKRLAFVEYLKGAPPIEDTTDRHHCGRARSYFGFPENFINDMQICEDIEQLKFAHDFDFLDEFFNQGSDVATTGDDGDAPVLQLIPPDRTESGAPAVQGHDAWEGTICGLESTNEALDFIIERIKDQACPCDPLCVSQNVCNAVKEVVVTVFTIIFQAVVAIFKIAKNLFGLLSDEEEVVRDQENTEVIYDNMQLIADYLVEMRTEIKEISDASIDKRDLRESSSGNNNEPTSFNYTLAQAILDSANFEVKLKPMQVYTSKSVIALSTLNGVRVDTDFTFSKLDQNSMAEVPVEFNRTDLASGKSVITFGEDVDSSTVLFMEARPINGTQATSDMLSFS